MHDARTKRLSGMIPNTSVMYNGYIPRGLTLLKCHTQQEEAGNIYNENAQSSRERNC